MAELEGFYLKVAFSDGFLLDPELKVLNLPVGQNGNKALQKVTEELGVNTAKSV